DGPGPGGLEPPGELERKQQVGQLRLRVRPPAGVVTLAREVAEFDQPSEVGHAADGHHAGARLFLERAQQQAGQRKVPEVVGAQLELKAVRRPGVGGGHDAGVVDEEVQPVAAGPEVLAERTHRAEVGEVERRDLNLCRRPGGFDLLSGRPALGLIATGQDKVRAPRCQLSRDDAAEAAVGAGHDGDAAALVRHLGGKPLCAHLSYPASNASTSSRRKESTSVTRPMLCQLPRSASLVTTAGFMSTQTVCTAAGRRLPVAIECSIVESISAIRTSGSAARIRSWASMTSGITSGGGQPAW